jgi:hypothetical protein
MYLSLALIVSDNQYRESANAKSALNILNPYSRQARDAWPIS